MDFSVRRWQLIAQPRVQRQAGRDFIGVLGIGVRSLSSYASGKVANSLQEEHGRARQETSKRITVRKGRKDKKAVGGDALQGVDVVVPVPSAKLQLMPAMNPA